MDEEKYKVIEEFIRKANNEGVIEDDMAIELRELAEWLYK